MRILKKKLLKTNSAMQTNLIAIVVMRKMANKMRAAANKMKRVPVAKRMLPSREVKLMKTRKSRRQSNLSNYSSK
jgi:hypothetical protein